MHRIFWGLQRFFSKTRSHTLPAQEDEDYIGHQSMQTTSLTSSSRYNYEHNMLYNILYILNTPNIPKNICSITHVMHQVNIIQICKVIKPLFSYIVRY